METARCAACVDAVRLRWSLSKARPGRRSCKTILTNTSTIMTTDAGRTATRILIMSTITFSPTMTMPTTKRLIGRTRPG